MLSERQVQQPTPLSSPLPSTKRYPTLPPKHSVHFKSDSHLHQRSLTPPVPPEGYVYLAEQTL